MSTRLVPEAGEININFDGLLKMGYAVIDVRYHEYDATSETYKYVIVRADNNREDFYNAMIKGYTGKDLKEKEIYELWIEILKHKLKMSNLLKRDVSIKVAALDYMENNK